MPNSVAFGLYQAPLCGCFLREFAQRGAGPVSDRWMRMPCSAALFTSASMLLKSYWMVFGRLRVLYCAGYIV